MVDVSVTVTVHAEPWLARTGLVHETVVVVGCTPVVTTMLVEPLLEL